MPYTVSLSLIHICGEITGITSQSRIRSTAPLPRGASGEEIKLSEMPRPPLDRGGSTASAVTAVSYTHLEDDPGGGVEFEIACHWQTTSFLVGTK